VHLFHLSGLFHAPNITPTLKPTNDAIAAKTTTMKKIPCPSVRPELAMAHDIATNPKIIANPANQVSPALNRFAADAPNIPKMTAAATDM
jgi:hypothetical protein